MIPRFQEDTSNNNQLFYMSTAAAGVMCILFSFMHRSVNIQDEFIIIFQWDFN